MDLEAFELVLLRRPANPPDYHDAELERIQREHVAYHAKLRDSGHVVTNGPVHRTARSIPTRADVLPDRIL